MMKNSNKYFPENELTRIDERRSEERTKDGVEIKMDLTSDNHDNTLNKYFFAEESSRKNNIPKKSNLHSPKITPEMVDKLLRKPIKLRNALKQCYWERSNPNVNEKVYLLILRKEHII